MDSTPDTKPTISSRPTARQQIEQMLASAQAADEPLRIRIPVTLYNAEANRSYTPIADTVWNLSYPNSAGVETIEAFISALGACLIAITLQGSATVLRKLEAGE